MNRMQHNRHLYKKMGGLQFPATQHEKVYMLLSMLRNRMFQFDRNLLKHCATYFGPEKWEVQITNHLSKKC
jgi:hypothetical protein